MHPIVKILWFIFVLLLINFLSDQWLWALCTVLCALAAKLHFNSFLRVVKRMRWLFISIFIIYAFGTPGEYIQQFPVNVSPTYEGLQLGLSQISKLLIALALLSILFATSTKENLMSGLYLLLSPLKLLGFDVERFTARLILTLDYVENLAGKQGQKFHFHQLDDIYSATDNLQTEKTIVLETVPFSKWDKLMMVIFVISPFGFMFAR
jgi:energy-coupling factor transporter transmembrane protein EcfT